MFVYSSKLPNKQLYLLLKNSYKYIIHSLQLTQDMFLVTWFYFNNICNFYLVM